MFLEHLLPPQDLSAPLAALPQSLLKLSASYLHASSDAVSAQPPSQPPPQETECENQPQTSTISQLPGGMAEAQPPARQGCGPLT